MLLEMHLQINPVGYLSPIRVRGGCNISFYRYSLFVILISVVLGAAKELKITSPRRKFII
jgi:hypothetical protein